MLLSESSNLILAASGGDTVKLFDISGGSQNPCVVTYSPSPGSRINSVKWNHNNLVLASAGDDSRISLWRKNGQSLWSVPLKSSRGDSIETSESISAISFSNKGSRYLCSGGTSQVVRIWDLQNKRCVKWLKGHTDTITGVMYNCKDEHIASVSRKGDLILHNLASGTRATELKDPNEQVLGALDYSRMSRHLLLTAGDDGSVHLWDTTSRSPKVSWLNQHSAPTSGVSFSPSNDKIIASVGLDMKIYTYDSGSKKPSSCIPYEAPFSSLAFTDDGLTLAAGTSTGQVVFYDVRGKPQPITVLRAYGNSEAINNIGWQKSKPVKVNESNCTDENVLLAGDIGDSVIMPDPLPSRTSSSHPSHSVMSGTRNPGRTGSSGDSFSLPASSSETASNAHSSYASEETPLRSSLLNGGALARLKAPRGYNFKDDMDVFSPLVEVQPMTPSLDKLWDDRAGTKKDPDRKPSFLFPSRKFGLSEEGANDNHPVFDWKSYPSSKLDDIRSTFSKMTSTPVSTQTQDYSNVTPTPDSWGGERLSDKLIQHRQSVNMPSRFGMLSSTSASSSGSQHDSLLTDKTSSLASGLSLKNLHTRETSNHESSLESLEAVASPLSSKDTLGLASSFPRKFFSYAERIGATSSLGDVSSTLVGSPKVKKTGVETREELLNSMFFRTGTPFAMGTTAPATTNGEADAEKTSLQSELQQGSSFTLQLFQHTLEETLASFQKSIHEDTRNLHIEILRQFHLQEIEMASTTNLILKNQAEIMKEIQLLRKETQELRRLL